MDPLSRYTIVELFDLLLKEPDDRRAGKILEEIIGRNGATLLTKLHTRVGDDGEAIKELFSDVMLDVWTCRQKGYAVTNPDVWLLRVADNKIADYLTKKVNEREQMAEYVEDYLRAPENHPLYDDALAERMSKRVIEAIAGLPPRQKRYVKLAKLEGMSIKWIAKALRRSESSIKNLIGVAKGKLRVALRKPRKGGWE